MPHKILPTTSFYDLKMMVFFTRAALQADPDAAQLLPRTEGWLLRIEVVEKQALANLAQRMVVDAKRMVANARLDGLCTKFGDRLTLAVNKDRSSVRFKRYFHESVWKFVKQPLQDQVRAVNGWLTTEEPELDPVREALGFWANRAQEALDQEPTSRLATSHLDEQREVLAAELTRDRDALERDLDEVAEEKDLGRGWSAGFFLKLS